MTAAPVDQSTGFVPSPRRILLLAERVAPAGGFIRFERLAQVLGPITCAVPDPSLSTLASRLPVVSWEQAATKEWDLTMVPGAGFSDSTIKGFSAFRDARFGLRMQHILNDRSRLDAFLAVNQAFKPHVVVFNNLDWPAGSFKAFFAERFHTVLGAVDPEHFRFHPERPARPGDRWVIGGLAKKNPMPLIEALARLPERASLRLFGHDRLRLAKRFPELVDAGRLELVGLIPDAELPDYYLGVDCVVSTETFAGWSSLCAEAMASGVPVVCTPHGTRAFARDGETALVVSEPEPSVLAERLRWLMTHQPQAAAMTRAARSAIEAFTWTDYARRLLAIAYRDGHGHYVAAPRLGLYGKWPLAERLSDIDPLLGLADGARIIDFGGAEGVIAHAFLERSAALVRSFELEPARVAFARRLCAPWPEAVFREADLSDWDGLLAGHADWLDERYDIVLYLGIHHHLPPAMRMRLLDRALDLADRFFAIRTPQRVWASDGLEEVIAGKGFRARGGGCLEQTGHLGVARIFERQQ